MIERFRSLPRMIAFMLAAAIVCFCWGCAPRYAEPAADVEAQAAANQRAGWMSADEYRRVTRLLDRAENGGSLDSGDVDRLLALAGRPGTPVQEERRVHAAALVLSECHRSSLPPERETAVYDFAKRLATRPTDTSLDAQAACWIMRRMGGKACISDLQPLLSNPDPDVRRTVHQTIRRFAQGRDYE